MIDTSLYDGNLYDGTSANRDIQIYDNSKYGVEFGNGFFIPNSFMRNCVFTYLQPIDSNYGVSRQTQVETRVHSIQKTSGEILITGTVTGTTRHNLIKNIEYMKKHVRNDMHIVIKDDELTRGANVFIENIQFLENHYNHTFMQYEISASFRDYMTDEKPIKHTNNVTANNNEIDFINSGLETHYRLVLEYTTLETSDISINVNGVNVIIPDVTGGDIIIIDTKTIEVKKNNNEVVFGGILTKLQPNNNKIIISDNQADREYKYTLIYKNTIN